MFIDHDLQPRAAPSAARILISFFRVMARASSRFETLTQAISITTATAPINTSSGEKTFVPRSVLNENKNILTTDTVVSDESNGTLECLREVYSYASMARPGVPG
jgi:hypothetical protein